MPTVAERVSQHCLDLFDQRTQSDIDVAFSKFDAENPRIWEAFIRLANEAVAAGMKRWSSDAILHVVRYEMEIKTKRAHGEFAINNNFSSRYARKAGRLYPHLKNLFETRRLKGEPV